VIKPITTLRVKTNTLTERFWEKTMGVFTANGRGIDGKKYKKLRYTQWTTRGICQHPNLTGNYRGDGPGELIGTTWLGSFDELSDES
jgi:hypothetical protein